jgi:uncharacterized protein DUF3775
MARDGLDTPFGFPELGIDHEKVANIIEKARMFDVKEEVTDPGSGSNATDDNMRDVLEDLADDPTQQELMAMIRNLNEDEQINLVALAWVGRGTYDVSQWNEALSEARGAHNNHTAEYLAGLPLLGDYLEEGLAALEDDSEAIEVHPLKHDGSNTGR